MPGAEERRSCRRRRRRGRAPAPAPRHEGLLDDLPDERAVEERPRSRPELLEAHPLDLLVGRAGPGTSTKTPTARDQDAEDERQQQGASHPATLAPRLAASAGFGRAPGADVADRPAQTSPSPSPTQGSGGASGRPRWLRRSSIRSSWRSSIRRRVPVRSSRPFWAAGELALDLVDRLRVLRPLRPEGAEALEDLVGRARSRRVWSTAWRITASTANRLTGEQSTTFCSMATSMSCGSRSWMNAHTLSFGMNSSTSSRVSSASMYVAARQLLDPVAHVPEERLRRRRRARGRCRPRGGAGSCRPGTSRPCGACGRPGRRNVMSGIDPPAMPVCLR